MGILKGKLQMLRKSKDLEHDKMSANGYRAGTYSEPEI